MSINFYVWINKIGLVLCRPRFVWKFDHFSVDLDKSFVDERWLFGFGFDLDLVGNFLSGLLLGFSMLLCRLLVGNWGFCAYHV
jgi:hypothetical protein